MSEGRELGWNDSIENDGESYVTLPKARYPFRVTKFERARYAGSTKIPPCNQANITIQLDGGEHGTATITEKLKLHSVMEWLLCQFFTCIGDRVSGERLVMNWDQVVGKTGWADVSVRTYKDDSGNEKTINQVDEWVAPSSEAAPAPQQPPSGTTGYTTGTF